MHGIKEAVNVDNCYLYTPGPPTWKESLPTNFQPSPRFAPFEVPSPWRGGRTAPWKDAEEAIDNVSKDRDLILEGYCGDWSYLIRIEMRIGAKYNAEAATIIRQILSVHFSAFGSAWSEVLVWAIGLVCRMNAGIAVASWCASIAILKGDTFVIICTHLITYDIF